jgi:hypothetical protein
MIGDWGTGGSSSVCPEPRPNYEWRFVIRAKPTSRMFGGGNSRLIAVFKSKQMAPGNSRGHLFGEIF